jgi:hypothetical protein
MEWVCGEWDARHDLREGKAHVLSIKGECKIPATYRCTLSLHEPQEDPSVLLLDLDISNPSKDSVAQISHSEEFVQLFQENMAVIYLDFKMITDDPYEFMSVVDKETGTRWDKIRVKKLLQTTSTVKPKRRAQGWGRAPHGGGTKETSSKTPPPSQ